jgi:hypothetical protein
VYSCCEGAYRLNPSGIIAVPIGAVDYYCGGACVVETEDVLNCVASALDGFAFYNGASVEDVRYALRRGCSHTARRGPVSSPQASRFISLARPSTSPDLAWDVVVFDQHVQCMHAEPPRAN